MVAIRAVERGERYLGHDVRGDASSESGSDEERLAELTSRQAQVFLLLARGHSVSRVAATVGISNKTAYAKQHLRQAHYGRTTTCACLRSDAA